MKIPSAFALLVRGLAFCLVSAAFGSARGATPDFAAATAHTRGFQLASNLTLKVWAAEPQLANPVAFSFDESGRIYVAETHRYGTAVRDITQNTSWLTNDLALRTVADRVTFLLEAFGSNRVVLTQNSELVRRVDDTDGDGVADASEILASGFNSPADGTAAGVLVNGRDVWFANIPNLWRLRMDAEKKRVISRQSVAMGFGVHVGVTGHDLHGLVQGPDGRIYASWGDRGLDPATVPGLELHGANPDVLRDCGGVIRCGPDGSGLEIYCYGLRNPQELAFDDQGNLWTSDNDTAGEDPCRVLHLIPGGDYGWRCYYQHLEGFGPWVKEELWRGGRDGILPMAGTVSQGPSGLSHYPGTGFGDRFRGMFLHCDFPGGIHAFQVRAEGSSYVVDRSEKILWNCWPTDVDFGPDGALYVLDWISGWGRAERGRIYRVTPSGGLDGESIQVAGLLKAGFKNREVPELVGFLEHRDRRVRHGAQLALAESAPGSLDQLLDRVGRSSAGVGAIHALWAIGQQFQAGKLGGEVLGRNRERLVALLQHSDPEVRGQAAVVLGEAGYVPGATGVADLIGDASLRVRLLALQGALLSGWRAGGDRATVPWQANGLRMLEKPGAPDLFAESLVTRLLAMEPGLSTVQEWKGSTNPAVRRAVVLALRLRGSPDLVGFLRDPDPGVGELAARAIHDTGDPAMLGELAKWVAKVDVPDSWLSRAIHAAFRVGGDLEAKTLAAFARRLDAPVGLRAEAVDALGDWKQPQDWPADGYPKYPIGGRGNHPGGLDRITGGFRPLVDRRDGVSMRRNPLAAQRALLSQAGVIFGDNEPGRLELQRTMVDALRRLGARDAANGLADKFLEPGTPSSLRSTILPVLAGWRSARTPEIVRQALNDPDALVRAAALPHLGQLAEGDEGRVLTGLVDVALNKPGPETFQVAQAALTQLAHVEADISRWAIRFEAGDAAGEIPNELRLELIHLFRARLPASPVLRGWEKVATDTLEKRHLGTLAGGSAPRGEAIFREKAETQCSRCHSVGTVRTQVGPALDDVGVRLTRAQLLESILYPNKTLASGYETVVLTLKNSEDLSGRILRESDADVELLTSAGETVRVAKRDITTRDRAGSAMPDGLGELLTPREMRDLIEYLAMQRKSKLPGGP